MAVGQLSCKEIYGRSECRNVNFTPETYLDEEEPNEALLVAVSTGAVTKATLSKLTHVKQLSLSGNDFEKGIERGALCSPPNLTSLVIFSNRNFPKITKQLLEDCDKLEKIHLDQVDIENGAFANLINLTSLVINGSKLAEINPSFFNGLSKLKSLTISDSTIGKVGSDVFDDVTNLIQLNLSGDKLGNVPKLGRLARLEFLDLSNNDLNKLTWDEFGGLTSLQKLFLGQNSLGHVDVDKLLRNLPNLKRVFITPDGLGEDDTKKLEKELPLHNITLIYA